MFFAIVKKGRHEGKRVKVINVYDSPHTYKRTALCVLPNYQKANIPFVDLEEEKVTFKVNPNHRIIGEVLQDTQGRGLSKNMKSATNSLSSRPNHAPIIDSRVREGKTRICSECGTEYNELLRLGKPGKITECPECASEEVEKYKGFMIFSHKTAPEIEIKQGDKLIKEAKGLYKRRD